MVFPRISASLCVLLNYQIKSSSVDVGAVVFLQTHTWAITAQQKAQQQQSAAAPVPGTELSNGDTKAKKDKCVSSWNPHEAWGKTDPQEVTSMNKEFTSG